MHYTRGTSRPSAIQTRDISVQCTTQEGHLGPVHYRQGTSRSSDYRQGTFRSSALQTRDISAQCTTDDGHIGLVHYTRGTSRSSALQTRDISVHFGWGMCMDISADCIHQHLSLAFIVKAWLRLKWYSTLTSWVSACAGAWVRACVRACLPVQYTYYIGRGIPRLSMRLLLFWLHL